MQVFNSHQADVTSVNISPAETGYTFVSGGADKMAIVWDIRSAQAEGEWDEFTNDHALEQKHVSS